MIKENYQNIYSEQRTLGKGTFGEIKINDTGNYYLFPADSSADSTQLKSIAIKYFNDYTEYLHELYIYKHLNTLAHCDKMITKIYAYEENINSTHKKVHAIVLEKAYFTLNDIYITFIDNIVKKGHKINLDNLSKFLDRLFYIVKKLSNGLIYIHSKKIVHCDLKHTNIGIFEKCIPKFFDFGQSHTQDTIEQNYEYVDLSDIGTPGFKLYNLLAYGDFLIYIKQNAELSKTDKISLIFKILKINDIWALVVTLISILYKQDSENSPANWILLLCKNRPHLTELKQFYYIQVYNETTQITSEELCNSCDELSRKLMENFKKLLDLNNIKSESSDRFEKYDRNLNYLVKKMFEILKIICSFKILYETKTNLKEKITRLDEIYQELQHKLKKL